MPEQIHKPWLWALLPAAAFWGGRWLARRLVAGEIRRFTHRVMVDPYEDNLWEFFSAARRVGLQNIVELSLRAESGQVIYRPLGSPRQFRGMEGLVFNFAQLSHFPTPATTPVDTTVTIGPAARKPLRLQTPLLVSGMAYGLALSAKAKVALARGAALAGTASNTGQGPFLPAERRAAKKLVIQYSRTTWAKEPHVLRQADALEIQLGQGAIGGISFVEPAARLDRPFRLAAGLRRGQEAVVYARLPGLASPGDLYKIVSHLREVGEGVPVGVKFGASDRLEEDLQRALEAGVDYVVLEGGEAATKGSPPILQDDFGLPLVYGLCRSARFLQENGARGRVSLIVSGGLFNPGQFLKAMALGADAVYLGTAALFAMAHTQVLKALPLEPPTQVAWYRGKAAGRLNVQQAARHLGNFLTSCTLEMAEGARALGKTSLRAVGPEDLCALDPLTAQITGVRPAYLRPGQEKDSETKGKAYSRRND